MNHVNAIFSTGSRTTHMVITGDLVTYHVSGPCVSSHLASFCGITSFVLKCQTGIIRCHNLSSPHSVAGKPGSCDENLA